MLETKLLPLSSEKKKNSIPKMEAAGSSATLVPIYQTTRYHTPCDNNLYFILFSAGIPYSHQSRRKKHISCRNSSSLCYVHSHLHKLIRLRLHDKRKIETTKKKKIFGLLLHMTLLKKKSLNLYIIWCYVLFLYFSTEQSITFYIHYKIYCVSTQCGVITFTGLFGWVSCKHVSRK